MKKAEAGRPWSKPRRDRRFERRRPQRRSDEMRSVAYVQRPGIGPLSCRLFIGQRRLPSDIRDVIDCYLPTPLTFRQRIDLITRKRRHSEIVGHPVDEPTDGVDGALSAVVLQHCLMAYIVYEAAKGE